MSIRILAATDFGVLTLIQNNGNWIEDTSSMQDFNFTSIATSADGSVLAGTRQGLYLSTDGGRNWRVANQGLSQQHIRSLAFHPNDQTLAYAGTEPAAIFYSKDGGKSWDKILYLNDRTGAADFDVDPSNPDKMLVNMWRYRRCYFRFMY